MTDHTSGAHATRTASARLLPWSALVWHLAGATAILLVPSQLLLGQPFWALSPEQTAQVLGMVAAYLALAFAISFFVGVWARLVASIVGGIACFGAVYGVLALNPDLPVARALVIVSSILGIVLASTGEFLYGSLCAECHRPGPGTFVGAPDLVGVVDRPIASTDWQGYSPALQRLEGSWTEEILDAFLSDPDSVAPGNRMPFPGIAEPAQRQLIIDYLATHE